MSQQIPSIGRIVHYTMSAANVEQINRRRADAKAQLDWHREHKTGSQIHVGNSVSENEVYPMMITRVWGDEPDSMVNGQVFLDGNDLFWTTSVHVGEGPGKFAWPAFVPPKAKTGAAA